MDMTSLPFESVAIFVNEKSDRTKCSFHIREKSKTIEAIDAIIQAEKLWGQSSKAIFTLVSRKIEETEVFISCFLFMFNIGDLVVYGILFDPMKPLEQRFLEGLTIQDSIALNFYDDKHMLSVTGNNIFKAGVRSAVSIVAGKARQELFQDATDEVLTLYPTPRNMWDKLERDSSL